MELAPDVEDVCPNCSGEPDSAIEPMPDGSCGVCAGTRKITWKDTGLRTKSLLQA